MMYKVNDLIIYERIEKVNNLKLLKSDINARLEHVARQYELIKDKAIAFNPKLIKFNIDFEDIKTKK